MASIVVAAAQETMRTSAGTQSMSQTNISGSVSSRSNNAAVLSSSAAISSTSANAPPRAQGQHYSYSSHSSSATSLKGEVAAVTVSKTVETSRRSSDRDYSSSSPSAAKKAEEDGRGDYEKVSSDCWSINEKVACNQALGGRRNKLLE